MNGNSSVETVVHVFPRLYWRVLKDLRKELNRRVIFCPSRTVREDTVEIVWFLVGQDLIDLGDQHSMRGMWSWREEKNIALAINHCVLTHIQLESYTQYDLDAEKVYHHEF